MTETEQAIFVLSDVAPDGTYVATLQVDDDTAVVLDRQRALDYALTVYTAIARAEHDAAVIRQLVALGIEAPAVAKAVADLQEDRPPLDDAATEPVRFLPFVTLVKMEPQLWVEIKGHRVGHWTMADARQHAGHVLQVCAGVDLDYAYFRFLRGVVGLDESRARAVVGKLAEHNQWE